MRAVALWKQTVVGRCDLWHARTRNSAMRVGHHAAADAVGVPGVWMARTHRPSAASPCRKPHSRAGAGHGASMQGTPPASWWLPPGATGCIQRARTAQPSAAAAGAADVRPMGDTGACEAGSQRSISCFHSLLHLRRYNTAPKMATKSSPTLRNTFGTGGRQQRPAASCAGPLAVRRCALHSRGGAAAARPTHTSHHSHLSLSSRRKQWWRTIRSKNCPHSHHNPHSLRVVELSTPASRASASKRRPASPGSPQPPILPSLCLWCVAIGCNGDWHAALSMCAHSQRCGAAGAPVLVCAPTSARAAGRDRAAAARMPGCAPEPAVRILRRVLTRPQRSRGGPIGRAVFGHRAAQQLRAAPRLLALRPSLHRSHANRPR
jgi:hypothetical protein